MLEHMVRSAEPSARQLLFLMLETLSKEEFAIMEVTLWAIWFTRRKIIFDGEFQSPLTTHVFVENYMRDLSIVYPSATKGTPGVRLSHPRWIAPPEGFAKFNVDAAVAKNTGGGALGVVCRSAGGVFLGASSLVVAGISDPATLEALACRETLALAEDLNIQKMVVASDCLQVINNIHGDFGGSYSMVTREIKVKASSFSDVRFRHENRASNSEAHRVARSFVSSTTGRQVWLLQPPEGFCIPLLINE
jgi:ribonuclease HI